MMLEGQLQRRPSAVRMLVVALALCVGAALLGSAQAATCVTNTTTKKATVSGMASPMACAKFYTSATGTLLGSSTFAAGTTTVTSAAYATAPMSVSLYASGCASLISKISCTTATVAPTTAAPTTAAPTTAKPTTAAPTTVAPTTVAPTTVKPTTAAPTTAVPTTAAPTTAAPTTAVPTTAVPTTAVPTTAAPTTAAPTTAAPTTPVPTTATPTTAAPTTAVPTTAAPTTAVPTTPVPTTAAPTTAAPTTAVPTTAVPTTPVPTTAVPTTPVPTTAVPTTPVPTTATPTTPVPTTPTPTTAAPTTAVPTTTTPAPMVYNGGAPAGQVRAMWVWGHDACLVGIYATNASFVDNCGYPSVQTQRDSFFYILRNPHRAYQPYNRIYFQVAASTLAGYPAQLQAFLAQAHANGIAVELLSSDTSTLTSAASAQDNVALCQAVAAFNAAAPANAELDGVHFDLEPHILTGWTINGTALGGKDKYNDYYETNLVSVFRGCKAALAGSGASLAWDAAVFYPKFATDIMTPLFNESLLDYITFMNYYNTETAFINGVGQTGGIAQILPQLKGAIPAVFGAETQASAPASQTWSANGSLPLENMFGNVGTAYASTAGFLGVATHDYDAYIFMADVGPPVAVNCTGPTNGTITVDVASLAIGSINVYTASAMNFVTSVNVAGSGPFLVKIPGNYASSTLMVLASDGPNLSRLAPDSLIYQDRCV